MKHTTEESSDTFCSRLFSERFLWNLDLGSAGALELQLLLLSNIQRKNRRKQAIITKQPNKSWFGRAQKVFLMAAFITFLCVSSKNLPMATFKNLPFKTMATLSLKKQELRAHMALVTRPEEPRAKNSYGMSSSKILRINRLL